MRKSLVPTKQEKVERYRRNAEECLKRSEAVEGSQSQAWIKMSAFWFERAQEIEAVPEETIVE